ncbi:SPW repeat domain-containing protein [Polyangium aurulentum]|uniref:SPW repeat domain-containing protein n=1 Tax=Polyangium aurulentum TaxID=2567896 RepID=UPI002010A2E8|nr:SPW repeat protein [Polyangium aurulentum]UQA60366.1 SPW repeat protein [Polyangium aurulentum]
MTWPRWINLALGVWLVLAPPLLGHLDANAWTNDRLLGVLIALTAGLGFWVPRVRFLNAAFGAWLIIAPFVLGYIGSRAIMNDIVVGIAVAVVSFIPSRALPRRTTGTGRYY